MFHKITHADYRDIVMRCWQNFSSAEQDLLQEILQGFEFNPEQEQALVQAVLQQSRFDPNAQHWETNEDDEDSTGVCPHCINPPAPPLRDYLMWRKKDEL